MDGGFAQLLSAWEMCWPRVNSLGIWKGQCGTKESCQCEPGSI